MRPDAPAVLVARRGAPAYPARLRAGMTMRLRIGTCARVELALPYTRAGLNPAHACFEDAASGVHPELYRISRVGPQHLILRRATAGQGPAQLTFEAPTYIWSRQLGRIAMR